MLDRRDGKAQKDAERRQCCVDTLALMWQLAQECKDGVNLKMDWVWGTAEWRHILDATPVAISSLCACVVVRVSRG